MSDSSSNGKARSLVLIIGVVLTAAFVFGQFNRDREKKEAIESRQLATASAPTARTQTRQVPLEWQTLYVPETNADNRWSDTVAPPLGYTVDVSNSDINEVRIQHRFKSESSWKDFEAGTRPTFEEVHFQSKGAARTIRYRFVAS